MDYECLMRTKLLLQCRAVAIGQSDRDLNRQGLLVCWRQDKALSAALVHYVVIEAFEFRISKSDADLFDCVADGVVPFVL